MYLKVKKSFLKPDKYGFNINITMIGLYDDNDKWIKWVTINQALVDTFLNSKIPVDLNQKTK